MKLSFLKLEVQEWTSFASWPVRYLSTSYILSQSFPLVQQFIGALIFPLFTGPTVISPTSCSSITHFLSISHKLPLHFLSAFIFMFCIFGIWTVAMPETGNLTKTCYAPSITHTHFRAFGVSNYFKACAGTSQNIYSRKKRTIKTWGVQFPFHACALSKVRKELV